MKELCELDFLDEIIKESLRLHYELCRDTLTGTKNKKFKKEIRNMMKEKKKKAKELNIRSDEREKGFQAIVGLDPKNSGGSFRYFWDYGEAVEWAKLEVKDWLKFKSKLTYCIKEVDLKECPNKFCKELCESNEIECLRCDHIRYDAMCEARENDEG